MLRFILLVIIFFFMARMVIRLVKGGLRFFYTDNTRRGSAPSSFSSGKHIEEADYEVIDSNLKSNLNNNERNVR